MERNILVQSSELVLGAEEVKEMIAPGCEVHR
jgi:hypothetical protein